MLLELRVKNFGIIEDMRWELSNGLNVITGETGAGKSLVIDALESLLAGKISSEVIRYGSDEASIEGVFSLLRPNCSHIKEFLSQLALDTDEQIMVIDCQLRKRGPTIVRVNGHAISKATLHEIRHLLVDIHGQSEHSSLLDIRTHLNFLDSYAHTLDLRDGFEVKTAELVAIKHDIETLMKDEQECVRNEDFLRFQFEEINQAQLRDGEDEELEKERIRLSSTEKLKTLSYESYRALSEDDSPNGPTATLTKLNETIQAMKKLVEIDPSLKRQMEILNESMYNLTEVAEDIRAYGDRLEYDPNRLGEVETRLELIRHIKRKYGPTIADVFVHKAEAEIKLDSAHHFAERRAQYEETVTHLTQEMGRLAAQLSKKRSIAAKHLKI